MLVAIARDGDDVLHPLVLADQLGAGDGSVVAADTADGDLAAVQLLAQRIEPGQGFGRQAAKGQLLDPVGEPAFQEAAVEGRRLGGKEVAPLLLQVGGRGGFQGREPAL